VAMVLASAVLGNVGGFMQETGLEGQVTWDRFGETTLHNEKGLNKGEIICGE
jgi:hypothetical protein